MFASIAKIDEVPHAVDKGIYTIHKDIDVVNLYGLTIDLVFFKFKRFLYPLQLNFFVIEFWVVSPSYNFDTLRIKAWKLHDVQNQLNRKLEKKKMKIDI